MVAQIPVLQRRSGSRSAPVAFAGSLRDLPFVASPSAFRYAIPARRRASLHAGTAIRDFLNEHYG